MTDENLSAGDRLEERKYNRKLMTEGRDAMMSWSMFACAALASGSTPKSAADNADKMIQETLKRFG